MLPLRYSQHYVEFRKLHVGKHYTTVKKITKVRFVYFLLLFLQVLPNSTLAAKGTSVIDAEHNYCTSDLAHWPCFL